MLYRTAGLLFLFQGVALAIGLATAQARMEETLVQGRAVYQANCAVCHGLRGDGQGQAAHMFRVQPRDFRQGIFKFRSTPSGSLPTDDDLLRTVWQGIRWTAMVGRDDLGPSDLEAVIQYLKSFSSRFEKEKPLAPVSVPPPPKKSAALVAEGRRLYREAQCAACHGESGRGDGPSAKKLKDDWGQPIRPSDLTWRPLKRGSEIRGIYLTLATGLSGTPMPSYGDALDGEKIWALVYYLESLVPAGQRLDPRQPLGEERGGWMALRMGGMMGRGMMGRGMMHRMR